MATKQGMRLIVYHTQSDLYQDSDRCRGERSIFEVIDYNAVDVGVIFEEAFSSSEVIEGLIDGFNSHNVPVMVIGKEHKNAISFSFDYETGFEQVVRHMIEKHKLTSDIVFMAGRKDDAASDLRLEVFKRVCEEHDIHEREYRIYYGDFWYGPTKEAVKEIISSRKIPKAFICANDSMAIATMEELQDHGIRIPEDVIVSGFDGIPGSVTCNPPLTTCKCSYDRVTVSLMRAIVDVLEGKEVPALNLIDFKVEPRTSCGCNMNFRDFTVGSLLKKSEDRIDNFLFSEYTLHILSSKLSFVSKIKDYLDTINTYHFYDMAVVVNGSSLNETIAPNMEADINPENDSLYLLYDSENKDRDYPVKLEQGMILPEEDMKRILDYGNPMIVSSICALGKRFGVLIYYFDVDQISYNRILQYSAFVTNSLINFRNIRYMKYVARTNERMSNHDYMTDLYNRKGFFKRLPLVVERARNKGERILVANFDLNGLKVINDKYGHEAGDIAIATFGKILLDLPYDVKVCGRFGGDEFAFCASVKSPAKGVFQTKAIESKFKKAVEDALFEYNSNAEHEFEVKSSFGVVISEVRNFDFNKSYSIADKKMYRMKGKKGKHFRS